MVVWRCFRLQIRRLGGLLMRVFQWLKQKHLSFKIGLISGLLHFIVSFFIAYNIIIWSQNAQWQFLWSLPFTIDLPISFLYNLVFCLPFQNFSLPFLPYPISEIRGFILPFFLHSVFGTIWYFYLPQLLIKIIHKIRNLRKTEEGVIRK